AVGRTALSAAKIWRDVQRLEVAGAFAVEMEVVPHPLSAEISRRTAMLVISMGAGAGCGGKYLFADDILGINTGHVPRHATCYRNFAAEYERLQSERIAAFSEFRRDVIAGDYPASEHIVAMRDEEFHRFMAQIESASTRSERP